MCILIFQMEWNLSETEGASGKVCCSICQLSPIIEKKRMAKSAWDKSEGFLFLSIKALPCCTSGNAIEEFNHLTAFSMPEADVAFYHTAFSVCHPFSISGWVPGVWDKKSCSFIVYISEQCIKISLYTAPVNEWVTLKIELVYMKTSDLNSRLFVFVRGMRFDRQWHGSE